MNYTNCIIIIFQEISIRGLRYSEFLLKKGG